MIVNENRRTTLSAHKRIIVKIGTTSLTYPNGKCNLQKIDKLSWVLTDLRNQGKEVILVSSGAIAVGTDRLGLAERPRDVMGKQAASAVGQAVLMQTYENFFMTYNQRIAQILLTRDVMEKPALRTNARNTFFTLLKMGVIPIVNENDSVSTAEVELDNDTLSALVTELIEGDLLINLSDEDGLYDSDPKKNPGAKLISEVAEFDERIEAAAGESSSSLGTGGSITKISAAKIAAAAGADMIIASGADPAVIFSVLSGANTGTLFHGRTQVKKNASG